MIAVIGDGDNDVAMFEQAGLSIAIGNGKPAAKAAPAAAPAAAGAAPDGSSGVASPPSRSNRVRTASTYR